MRRCQREVSNQSTPAIVVGDPTARSRPRGGLRRHGSRTHGSGAVRSSRRHSARPILRAIRSGSAGRSSGDRGSAGCRAEPYGDAPSGCPTRGAGGGQGGPAAHRLHHSSQGNQPPVDRPSQRADPAQPHGGNPAGYRPRHGRIRSHAGNTLGNGRRREELDGGSARGRGLPLRPRSVRGQRRGPYDGLSWVPRKATSTRSARFGRKR